MIKCRSDQITDQANKRSLLCSMTQDRDHANLVHSLDKDDVVEERRGKLGPDFEVTDPD